MYFGRHSLLFRPYEDFLECITLRAQYTFYRSFYSYTYISIFHAPFWCFQGLKKNIYIERDSLVYSVKQNRILILKFLLTISQKRFRTSCPKYIVLYYCITKTLDNIPQKLSF